MGILTKDEIIRRITNGELIINARKKKNGDYDVEPDSYDLSAGAAIWKEELSHNKYEIKTEMCIENCSNENQPTITVQPGQMVYVITQEEVKLPLDICGTVFSRNNIALEGILALNAGHVDPGYQGPIVIRLINLKATPWTLHIGNAIFTVTFQTIDHKDGDVLDSGPIYPFEKMVNRVRQTAENSLSNALFDLYANKIDSRLNEHYTWVQQRLRDEISKDFCQKNEIISCFFSSAWSKFIAGLLIVCALIGAICAVIAVT